MKKPDAVIKTEQLKQRERRTGVKNVKLTFGDGKLDVDVTPVELSDGFKELKVNPALVGVFEPPVEVLPEPDEWVKQHNAHGEFFVGDETMQRVFFAFKMTDASNLQSLFDAFEILMQRDKEVIEALTGLLDRYVGLVESGDAGFWDAEQEDCVIKARAALAKVIK